MSKTIDSYEKFLSKFKMERESFYQFGIDETIFVEYEKAEEQWNTLLDSLKNGDKLYIRRYGRQGTDNNQFIKMYNKIFESDNFKIDYNNSKPLNTVESLTGYKRYKESMDKKNNIVHNYLWNYQCSHIFGCTKNPLLYTAAWNICFTPKIFDPLTGHETVGNWPTEYQKLLHKKVFDEFKTIINDYNNRAKEIRSKIEKYIVDNTHCLSDTFKDRAREEWAEIKKPENT